MQVKLLFFLVLASLLHAEFINKVENSNFTLSQDALNDKTYLYNYDRLRLRSDYIQENFFATLIADGVNYYGDSYTNSLDFAYIKQQKSDTPFKTQTSFHTYDNGAIYAKLYRLYTGYEDDFNRIVLGLQNITMGVGHIWTPTNIFNPVNTYALEPDETFGVFALSYTRHFSDTSKLSCVVSQRADDSYKYALQYKAYFNFADFGVDILHSDDTDMIGYEIEANVADTGIEARSEGAYINNNLGEFFQGIVGADYAFVNGITLTTEALYSSKTFPYSQILLNSNSEITPNLVNSYFYAAVSLTYSFNIYLDGSLLYIESFNKNVGRFVAPNLTYTLNDYNSFSAGALLEKHSDTYYFKWVLAF
ncbi:hypothetical protein [Sulfurimonas sp.]|uniref:hypothetical protein n=1 Tax=Sulfurimonas sp. TaxID=2022749 RepID=UPI003D1358EC